MKASIIYLKQILLLTFIPLLCVRYFGKKSFPCIERLYKDLINLMNQTKNYCGDGHKSLSEIYQLHTCEKICVVETQLGICQIQFKGVIELLDTIYDYGKHGYRTNFIANKFGLKHYKGEINKGTIVPIKGMIEYKLARKGWEYEGHLVSVTTPHAPKF